MADLSSLEIEKNCICSLLHFPKVVTDLPSEINAEDFSLEIHRIIFTVIRGIIQNGETPNKILISEKIRRIGVVIKEDFDIYEYLDALELIQINETAIFPLFQELKKLSICRGLDSTVKDIREAIRSNLDLSAPKIISLVDGIYNKHLDLYDTRHQDVIDIYTQMEGLLMERASNPTEEMGISTPFPVFNRYFGGLRPGNVYVWASRAGEGKSTLLNYLANQMAWGNKKIKVLYLDTEMETNDIILRMAATMCDVPMWYLDTGQWIKNKEMHAKVMAAMKTIKEDRAPNFYHRYVANVSVDEIISIIRRWYYSYCQRLGADTQAIVVYDYLKITGERVSNDNKEYQIIGEKVNKLKEAVTKIGAPLLTAVQVNRTGVNKHGEEATDDDSIIALSDRIKWFCSYLGIFRRKTFAEIDRDGTQFGTHLLITLKGRFQGRSSQGHLDWVKIEEEGKRPIYRQNYINFNVCNFAVGERSSLRDMVSKPTLTVENAGKVRDFYTEEPEMTAAAADE